MRTEEEIKDEIRHLRAENKSLTAGNRDDKISLILENSVRIDVLLWVLSEN